MPKPIANFETYATKALSTSGTELFIFDVTDDAGNSLDTKSVWVTIDDGTSSAERGFGVVDAANKKITLSLRGVDPNDSTVEVTALKFQHDKGASVKITDAHYLLQVTEMLSGDIDLQGVPKLPSARTISDSRELVDKEYADALTVASLTDFATVDAGGLDVNVNAGTLVTATGTIDFAGVSGETLTDDATNYIELDENGNLAVNTSGWVEGNAPLSKVVTASGDISSISLTRGFITTPITDNTITDDYTFGATIAVNDLLYLDTSDAKWKLADASAASTCTGQLGFALEAGVDTDTGKRVQLAGVVTGLSGLTAGWQHVSDTAGDVSNTAGTYKKMVGYAPNTTTLIMMPSFSVEQLSGTNSDTSIANMNEAMTFFGNTDMTATEAETLTAGSTSDAQSLHRHENVHRILGYTTSATTDQTITVPAGVLVDDGIIRATLHFNDGGGGGVLNITFGGETIASGLSNADWYEVIIIQTADDVQSAYVKLSSSDAITASASLTVDTDSDADLVFDVAGGGTKTLTSLFVECMYTIS